MVDEWHSAWYTYKVTTTGHNEAQLAGMMRGEAGELLGDAVFPLAVTNVPSYLELVGDRLYWSLWGKEDESGAMRPADHLFRSEGRSSLDPSVEVSQLREVMVRDTISQRPEPEFTKGMLDAFLRIGGGDDVLRFAQHYGILELCNHDQPIMYGQSMKCTPRDWSVCRPRGWPHICWEPIDGWLRFVRQAKAMVSIAAALNQGEPTKQTHWANLAWSDPKQPTSNSANKLAFSDQEKSRLGERLANSGKIYQRQQLAEEVGKWLRMGGVEPLFTWSRSGPSIGLTGTTFGTLAVQLMFAVGKSQAIAVCNGCGQPYMREGKKPQKGRRNFCPSCGSTVASRLRKRDKRAADQRKGTD